MSGFPAPTPRERRAGTTHGRAAILPDHVEVLMRQRAIVLVAAALVAAAGSVLIFLYVMGANRRALEDQQPVTVLVAKTTIAAGTSGALAESSGSLEQKTVARDSVAPTALQNTETIRDLVALTPIFAGEQILASKFGPPSSERLTVPDGKAAISVQLSDPARVAGFVRPGSEVAIMATLSGVTPPPGAAATDGDFTATLLPKVTVLATGNATATTLTTRNPDDTSTTEQVPTAILTLAVTEAEAQKVVYAQSKGELYLALLGPNAQLGAGSVSGSNVFGS